MYIYQRTFLTSFAEISDKKLLKIIKDFTIEKLNQHCSTAKKQQHLDMVFQMFLLNRHVAFVLAVLLNRNLIWKKSTLLINDVCTF